MLGTGPVARTNAPSLLTLDLVRALAAFTVLVSHTKKFTWVGFEALPAEQQTIFAAAFCALTRIGFEAVMVFFILSGFLVGGKILDRVKTGQFRISDYALDRATRILIPLVPACLLTLAVNAICFGQSPNFLQALGNMAGLNGSLVATLDSNGPLWSLSHEIWFYVLAGAVGYIVSSTGTALSMAVLWICALVFAKIGSEYLVFWTLGALSTRILHLPRPGQWFLLGLAIMAAGVILFQLGLDNESSKYAVVPTKVALGLICFGCCVCMPFLCSPAASEALLFCRKPIAFASSFSYSLYLTHLPINTLLGTFLIKNTRFSIESFSIFALRLLICILFSIIFYFIFERNTASIRRFLRGLGWRTPSPARQAVIETE